MSNLSSQVRSEFDRYWIPMLAVIILSIMARGQTLLNPLYSIDGYAVLFTYNYDHYPHTLDPYWYQLLMSQGRYGGFFLWWLRDALGYFGIGAGVSSLLLSVVLFPICGLLFAKAIVRDLSVAEAFIFCAIFVLHPFVTEYYYFSDITLNAAISVLIAAAGVAAAVFVRRPAFAFLLGTTLITLAMTMNQLVIASVSIVAVMAMVAQLMDWSPASNWPRQSPIRWRAVMFSPPAIVVWAGTASVLIYLVSILVVERLSSIPLDGRTDTSALLDVSEKLAVFLRAVKLALWPVATVVPHIASVDLLVLLVLSVAAVLWLMLRRGRILTALICCVLLGGVLLGSVGLSAAGRTVWLVPRNLVPIATFAAGLFVLGWRTAPPIGRAVSIILLSILLITYVGASNRILFDQRRVNLWDMQQANRFVNRLELLPHYGDMRSLAVFGGDWRRASRLSTAIGDMNVSALAVLGAKNGVIEQATGQRFLQPNDAEKQAAEDHCKSVDPWPAAQSVVIVGSLGIVCLPKPR